MRRLQAFGWLMGLVMGLASSLPAGGCSRRVAEPAGKRDAVAADDSKHGSREQKPVAIETRDPHQQLLDRRERLRHGSTIVLDRTIPELPPRTAAYFHRLRQVSGELAVLRELIRWATDPAHATPLEPPRRDDLKRWERCWRDWENELASQTPLQEGEALPEDASSPTLTDEALDALADARNAEIRARREVNRLAVDSFAGAWPDGTPCNPLLMETRRTLLRFPTRTLTADDLLSEGICRLYARIDAYRISKGPFLGWWHVLVRNRLADLLRRERAIRRLDENGDQRGNADDGSAPAPEDGEPKPFSAADWVRIRGWAEHNLLGAVVVLVGFGWLDKVKADRRHWDELRDWLVEIGVDDVDAYDAARQATGVWTTTGQLRVLAEHAGRKPNSLSQHFHRKFQTRTNHERRGTGQSVGPASGIRLLPHPGHNGVPGRSSRRLGRSGSPRGGDLLLPIVGLLPDLGSRFGPAGWVRAGRATPAGVRRADAADRRRHAPSGRLRVEHGGRTDGRRTGTVLGVRAPPSHGRLGRVDRNRRTPADVAAAARLAGLGRSPFRCDLGRTGRSRRAMGREPAGPRGLAGHPGRHAADRKLALVAGRTVPTRPSLVAGRSLLAGGCRSNRSELFGRGRPRGSSPLADHSRRPARLRFGAVHQHPHPDRPAMGAGRYVARRGDGRVGIFQSGARGRSAGPCPNPSAVYA